jgi:CelD/BcsL family acetyltransferase involved in cellulose biosynthesis
LTQIVRTEADFLLLKDPWNDLLHRSIMDVPFLRHEYLSTWWSTLGGGEWPSGELCLVQARDEADRMLGVAPLFRAGAGRQAVLRWVGSREVTDFLDVIVAPEHLSGFVEAAFDELDGEPWQAIELDNMLESSPALPHLESAARRRGWETHRERQKPCPLVRIDGGWEAYLAVLDKKQRHELRRKMRRAHAYPGGAEVRYVRSAPGLEAEVETFLSLMARDPAKAAFLTPAMRRHFHGVARQAADAGWLELAFLELAGKAAAAYFNFDYRNRIWVYNSGLDPDFLWLSPGWALIGDVIEGASARGREAVDFLRGEETYKLQLGGVVRHVETLRITRPG